MTDAYRQFREIEGQRTVRRSAPLPRMESRRGPRRVADYTPCRCGECQRCRDNAKWERIFNEKFADPEYYAPRTVTHGSSLSWLK